MADEWCDSEWRSGTSKHLTEAIQDSGSAVGVVLEVAEHLREIGGPGLQLNTV